MSFSPKRSSAHCGLSIISWKRTSFKYGTRNALKWKLNQDKGRELTYIFYRYRGKQGRESEEHDGHDEVDQVADGEDYQEGVELPLELLAAELKNGNEISENPKNSHTRL